ncbi:MAG: GatB/YqeY domain-containing protein [Cytophagaceae bacterium]|nr:GatB/YqeY domain-containing protein [Cytophagaceae bacterium]MDW8457110.1 GatB/YqeY domain-containing protein [Cytophagaceae bacterium]
MTLKEQIEADIKKAMLAKNQSELLALRSIKSLILLAETEKGAKEQLSKDAEMKLLMKAAKQRKESAEVYQKEGRKDLEEKELAELAVIERYLPKPLSEEELTSKIKDIITKTGAKTTADMGKVMGIATKELAGQADGKLISELVKKLLA